MRIIILFLVLLGTLAVIYGISRENRDVDICLTCHATDLNLDKRFPHPLVKEGRCLICHTSYDLNLHKEETKPTLEVCEGCHSQEKLGRSHPVGYGIIDQNTGDTMTCTSTCHVPHASDYKYQLPYKNNMELCLSCHKEF